MAGRVRSFFDSKSRRVRLAAHKANERRSDKRFKKVARKHNKKVMKSPAYQRMLRELRGIRS